MSSNPENGELLRTLAESVSGLQIQMSQVLGELKDFNQQIRTLTQRVDSLDRRLTALEQDHS
jgi:ubiquinone biosynthesis protein UbiJ